jgi:hypothetical protein
LGQFQRNLSVLFNMGDENLAHDRNRRGSAEYNPAGAEDSSSDLNRPTGQATALKPRLLKETLLLGRFPVLP